MINFVVNLGLFGALIGSLGILITFKNSFSLLKKYQKVWILVTTISVFLVLVILIVKGAPGAISSMTNGFSSGWHDAN